MNGRRSKQRRYVRAQPTADLALVEARYFADGDERLVRWFMRGQKLNGLPWWALLPGRS